MNQEKDLWQLEEQFWLGDAEFYKHMLAEGALMVLPQPVGILDRAATINSISAGARWQTVTFSQQRCVFQGSGIAVLVYCAQADRGEADSEYAAQCSSTYVGVKYGWQLVLHHQTPLGHC